MKNKIIELNNLYKPALEKVEQVRKTLYKHCVDHAIMFSNDHHIKIDNKVESVQYPIPSIICKLNGIKTKIGIDLVTDTNYIGFVKFTLCKEQFDSFNFDAIKLFNFEVYGFYYYEDCVNFKNVDKLKTNMVNSNETTLYIKLKVRSIDEIISIISNLSNLPQKGYAICSYICNCGHEVSVEAYHGQCPICGKDSIRKRKYKAKCPVCKENTLKDQYGNGECENCGWNIDKLSSKNKGSVIYPNLISLNKARMLYKEGKPFKPDLSDFLEALDFYGEMLFKYKDIDCELFRSNNEGGISFYYEVGKPILFEDKNDFIQNAKIENEYVRDIWAKVEDPKYM